MTGWMEIGRGQVFPWECDQYGHLNTNFYFAKFNELDVHLLLDCGLTFNALRKRDLAIVVAMQKIQYLQELRAGDLIRIEGALIHVGNTSLRLAMKMWNAESGELNATCEATLVLTDNETRRPAPWLADHRCRVEDAVVALDDNDRALFPD